MAEIDNSKLIRHKLSAGRESPLETYKNLTVGDVGWLHFLWYEFVTMFLVPMPGGLGFLLRKKAFRYLFKEVGKGLIIGRNVVIRHPRNIRLGDNVTIDDNVLVDGRGAADGDVVMENEAIVNRNCMIQAKGGPIRIGRRTTIGSNSVIVSTAGVELGASIMTAGNCYLSAGAYHVDQGAGPIMDQGAYSSGPIVVGDGAWLGTGAIVLDGVTIGQGAVIGAGAVVNRNVPANAIAVGVPARIVRQRGPAASR
jgi:acetyltransferase-like isoleucine patch superfamily enzyme